MFNFHLSYQWIRWRRPTAPAPALPETIERIFIQTPSGPLELLFARPSNPTGRNPVFFAHGGMGSAWVFIPYMQYLSQRGIPCYAISCRGHGESWCPSFLRMVYGTSRRALANDLLAGIRWVQEKEGKEVVLAGHSSGGGLSQYLLSEGDIKVKALVLMAAVPGFGSFGVYMNWAFVDPWFTLRMLFHGWHPNSPLSHPELTKRIFFSDSIPDSQVLEFQKHICPYESFLWPLAMMRPFVNSRTILQNITGGNSGQRLMVLAGGSDKIMTFPIMKALANIYRSTFVSLVREKKLEIEHNANGIHPLHDEGSLDDEGMGVRFCLVPGAGHHLQNDIQWKVGAVKLLKFYNQL